MIEIVGDEKDEKLIEQLMQAVWFLCLSYLYSFIPISVLLLCAGLRSIWFFWLVFSLLHLIVSVVLLFSVARGLKKLRGDDA